MLKEIIENNTVNESKISISSFPYTLITKGKFGIETFGFEDGRDLQIAMNLIKYCKNYDLVLGYSKKDFNIFVYSETNFDKINKDKDFSQFLNELDKKGKLGEIIYTNEN